MKKYLLPDFYQITPEPNQPPHFKNFLLHLDSTLRSGVKLVQLRAKNLGRQDHLNIAKKTHDLCHKHDAMLILNGSIEMALEIGCDGVHMTSQMLMEQKEHPAHKTLLISASCHSAEQLAQASQIGADFVTLSPVLPTRTHPEAEPLGWQLFAELAAASKVPVFALGGMAPELLHQAKQAGAWGIAAISSTWHSSASIQ